MQSSRHNCAIYIKTEKTAQLFVKLSTIKFNQIQFAYSERRVGVIFIRAPQGYNVPEDGMEGECFLSD
jgi:hypothetical protein